MITTIQQFFTNDKLLVGPNHEDILIAMGCQFWYPTFSTLHYSLPHLWPEKGIKNGCLRTILNDAMPIYMYMKHVKCIFHKIDLRCTAFLLKKAYSPIFWNFDCRQKRPNFADKKADQPWATCCHLVKGCRLPMADQHVCQNRNVASQIIIF